MSQKPVKQAKNNLSPNSNQSLNKEVIDNNQNLSEGNVQSTFSVSASPSNSIIKTYQPIQTPISELDETKTLVHTVSSTIFDIHFLPLIFEPKPLLSEVKGEDFHSIFITKCQQIGQVLDFSNDSNLEEKEAKGMMLDDLLHAVSDPEIVSHLQENEYTALYNCFIKNNVRIMPKPPDIWFAPVCLDFKLDIVEETGWPHLSLMYDVMTAFLSNPKFHSHYCPDITKSLFKSIILMFESPDQRERLKLTTLFHAFYKAFRGLRNDAQKICSVYLRQFTYCGDPNLCCQELLFTFVPIFSGYKVPLNPNHIRFFIEAVIPLHRSPNLYQFHNSLVSATTAMLMKNNKLSTFVFHEIFTHWPFTSPTKKIMLLKELELLADFVDKEEEKKIILPFTLLMAHCIDDQNFAVVERSLLIWESDSIMRITRSNIPVIFPLILPQIYKTILTHWSNDVKSLAIRTMRVLKGINQAAFDQVGLDIKKIENDKILKELKKGSTWNKLIDLYGENQEEKADFKEKLSKTFIGCEALSSRNPSSKTFNRV
ncbi:hypothetical protein M9Y10_033456 [Tritrichomonas musculus]|uniref:Phosphoprotein phosphatase n=1 Tax=Tritrichomonas musculus TaxID=1915356 RepID=A0ABR2KE56_9EUKA